MASKQQINLTALAVEQQMLQYADTFQAIAQAIVDGKEHGAERSEKAKAEASTVAGKVREYVAETAAAGVPAETAGDMLRIAFQRMGFPNGTALNYGRAVQGFRKLAEDMPDKWQEASVKDAQRAMESDATRELNAVRAEIAKYVKAATLEQARDVLETLKVSGIKLKERKVRSDKGQQEVPEAETQDAVAA